MTIVVSTQIEAFRERFQATELNVMLSLQAVIYVHLAKGFHERKGVNYFLCENNK